MAGSLVLLPTTENLSLSRQVRKCGTLAELPGWCRHLSTSTLHHSYYQGGVLEVGKSAVIIFPVTNMAECLGDQVPVADHHPLGRPRGAGGEGEDGWMGGRVERRRGEGWRGGEEGVEGEMAAHSFAICWSVG